MLKHGILGLLNYGDMTGYEIMIAFRDSLSYFWPAQTSQIYRELQNIKKKGWATDTHIPQAGKPDKKLFSITDSGKLELHRWLLEEATQFESKSPLLMQTFFRGELTPEENISFFQNIYTFSDAFLKNAQAPAGNITMYETAIQHPKQSLYWKMTMEYGIMYMNMLREWSSKCIQELEVQKNEHPDY